MNRYFLYKKAIKKWGNNAQIIMFFEELAELQKEIANSYRNRTNKEILAGEIVDAFIMLEQMKIVFRIPSKKIKELMTYKLNRLAQRLEAKC
jgi:hypothetical protein